MNTKSIKECLLRAWWLHVVNKGCGGNMLVKGSVTLMSVKRKILCWHTLELNVEALS